MMRAYVDESYRLTGARRGVYLLAVVAVAAVAPADEQPLRERLLRALPGRARRFHWHDDREAVREQAVRLLRAAPAARIVLHRTGVHQRLQERARQHALWNLVVDLRDREIHELTLEARERRQDDRDKRNLAAIVKAGVTGETFRYTFARPLDEPLLWLPDTLAGMAGTRWSTSSSRTSGLHTDLFEEIALPPLPGQA